MIYIFPISAGAYYLLEEVNFIDTVVSSVKIELRYFYYISLCYIDSIIVIAVLAYITVVALLLVAYFSIVMLWQDIYRIGINCCTTVSSVEIRSSLLSMKIDRSFSPVCNILNTSEPV
jgi:hypothetical protein